MIRPGIYSTEINIHNYHGTEVAVRKLVLPLVFDGKPRGREPEYGAGAGAGRHRAAAEYCDDGDCFQDWGAAGPPVAAAPPPPPQARPCPPPNVGYLEIVSTLPLAVYTVTDRERRSILIDVKRVEGRPKSEL